MSLFPKRSSGDGFGFGSGVVNGSMALRGIGVNGNILMLPITSSKLIFFGMSVCSQSVACDGSTSATNITNR